MSPEQSRWTVLPPLPVRGLRSPLVESLRSYVGRLARVSGASPDGIRKLAASAAHPDDVADRYTGGAVCAGVQQLTGMLEVRCTTLWVMEKWLATAPSGGTRDRLWCPRCIIEWDDEVSWEPLCWDLGLLLRCPVHQCRLESLCPSCGATQRTCAASSTHCSSCRHSLGSEGTISARSHYEIWVEHQIAQLLMYCSDPLEGQLPVEQFHEFREAFGREVAGDSTFTSIDRQTVLQLLGVRADGARALPSRHRMTLQRLLNICSLQGVGIMDLVLRPRESATRPLIVGWRDSMTIPLPPASNDALIASLRRVAEHMTADHRNVYIPPIDFILKAMRVTRTTLMDMAPDVYSRYEGKRQDQALERAPVHYEKSFRSAVWWLGQHARSIPKEVEVARLMNYAIATSSLSKESCERTVMAALRWHNLLGAIRTRSD